MVLEETHKSKQAMASANAAATTLVTTPTTPDVSKAPVSTSQSNTNNRNNTNCGRDSGSNNNRGRGRGRGRGSGGDTTSTRQRQPFNASLYQPWGPHPRPQQAYAASTTLTDLEQAMHTMNLQVPEQNWYNLTLWRPSRTAYLKDFLMGTPIMWCESIGDLYPLTTNTFTTPARSHSTFAVYLIDKNPAPSRKAGRWENVIPSLVQHYREFTK
ncbi:hypothetical protein Tco_1274761 [Tanacetum coccineum]